MNKFTTVDEYFKSLPPDLEPLLQQVREAIRSAAPDATEVISYQMPAFKQKGVLVYYAAFKDHISLFPTASGVAAFEAELAPYKKSRGTIQFPLDKPLPLDLVRRIVEFRVKEDQEKSGKKYTPATREKVAMRSDKVKDIEAKIADLKARWPPHSVPPSMWQQLEEFEEELEKAKAAEKKAA